MSGLHPEFEFNLAQESTFLKFAGNPSYLENALRANLLPGRVHVYELGPIVPKELNGLDPSPHKKQALNISDYSAIIHE